MKKILVTFVMIAGVALMQAQSIQYVTIMGNSISYFQAPFQPEEFPTLSSSDVHIWGVPGAPCSYFLNLDTDGNPIILSYVPAQTTVLVLIDSTNDIEQGISTQVHMMCMQQTIQMH